MSELSTEEMLASVATETPSNEAPASSEAAPAAAPQPQLPWWQEKLKEPVEYTTEGGKKIAEPLELILKRAGMGYNYAQKAHLLNSQAEHYKSLEQRIQELQKWNEYDEYAKKNPEWAKYVDENWSKRDAFGQQQANPEVDALKQKLAELEAVANEFKTEKQKIQQAQEDKVMASEISEVAKKFNVDLEQADENGSSLEWRVLEHMKNMGLDGRKGHFTAAFKDYYFENLVQMQKEQAQEAQVKQKSELAKAGIRGISSTPKQTGVLNGSDLSKLPWNKLGDLALNELMSNQKN